MAKMKINATARFVTRHRKRDSVKTYVLEVFVPGCNKEIADTIVNALKGQEWELMRATNFADPIPSLTFADNLTNEVGDWETAAEQKDGMRRAKLALKQLGIKGAILVRS